MIGDCGCGPDFLSDWCTTSNFMDDDWCSVSQERCEGCSGFWCSAGGATCN